jgi:hypothetical protein
MKVTLGHTVSDSITGFTGIATGRCEYITGCTQVLVQPRVKADGDFVNSQWLDEDRLTVVSDEPITLDVTKNGPDVPAPRGHASILSSPRNYGSGSPPKR